MSLNQHPEGHKRKLISVQGHKVKQETRKRTVWPKAYVSRTWINKAIQNTEIISSIKSKTTRFVTTLFHHIQNKAEKGKKKTQHEEAFNSFNNFLNHI